MSVKCSECRFFDPMPGVPEGYCVKNPPVAAVAPTDYEDDDAEEGGRWKRVTLWPRVSGEFDWCGAFVKAESHDAG